MKEKAKKSKNQIKKEPNPVGRPSKYDPKYCELLIEHMKNGASFESFAGRIGIWKEALYNWTKKHEEFSNALKIGRAKQHWALEKLAMAQATGQFKGSPATLIFILKNTIGWKDQPDQIADSYEDMEFME